MKSRKMVGFIFPGWGSNAAQTTVGQWFRSGRNAEPRLLKHKEGSSAGGSLAGCWGAYLPACVAGVFAAVAVCFVCLAASVRAGEVDKVPLLRPPGQNIDTFPVEMRMAGRDILIPRNYIVAAYLSGGRLVLQLFTSYPSFDGFTQDNFHSMRFGVSARSPDVIQITRLDNPEARLPFERSVSQAAREYGIKTNIQGVVQVKEGFKYWEALTASGASYFVDVRKNESDDVIIHCSPKFSTLSKCDFQFLLYNDALFLCEFNSVNLQNWESLYNGTRRLLAGFVRGEE